MMVNAGIAAIGALVGDAGRATMLAALMEGRALTAGELADRAGITRQTASGHLAKLLAANLILMDRRGRHRYHRLASPDVLNLLKALDAVGQRMSVVSRLRQTGTREPAMRLARSCYDHVAGRLGVALAEVLSDDVVTNTEPGSLSALGRDLLGCWGIDIDGLARGRRPHCRLCLDWSERRPHIGGAVGAAILERALALGWLQRREGTRALNVTVDGARGFRDHFGVRLEA